MAKRRNYNNLNYVNIAISVIALVIALFIIFSGVKFVIGSVQSIFSPADEKADEIPSITTSGSQSDIAKPDPEPVPAEPEPDPDPVVTTSSETAVKPDDSGKEDQGGTETPVDEKPVDPTPETPQETTLYGVIVGGSVEVNQGILRGQGKESKVLTRYEYQPQPGVREVIDGDVVTLVVEETLTKAKVYWLQDALKIAGFYTTPDGGYGNNTKATIAKYSEAVMDVITDDFTTDVEASLEESIKGKVAGDINDLLVLVNKDLNLGPTDVPANLVTPSVLHPDYVPSVRKEVDDALVEMFNAAIKDGVALRLVSAYRSYEYQTTLFNNYASKNGFDEANKYSALPGQSEHQTGLAVDLDDTAGNNTLSQSFETTKAFEWLDAHAHEYGFILRYPKNKEQFTKYIYEPWHYRYIGDVSLATYIKKNDLSFEEYKLTQGQ